VRWKKDGERRGDVMRLRRGSTGFGLNKKKEEDDDIG
jgi:hypothetical protein